MAKWIPPNPDVERQLATNLSLGWSVSEIRQADKEKLLTMQHRIALGSNWGCIEIPKNFMPDGTPQSQSKRIFTLHQFLPGEMDAASPIAEYAWTELLRYVVTRLTYSAGRTNSKPVGYSTLSTDLQCMKPIVSFILQTPTQDRTFWSRFDTADKKFSEPTSAAFQAIGTFHKMGALQDAILEVPSVVADEPERDREGEIEAETPIGEETTWQPLPMPFVAQIGWRSLRVIKVIAPALLAALERAVSVTPITHGAKGKPLKEIVSRQQTLVARNKVIADWNWRDESGASIECLVVSH